MIIQAPLVPGLRTGNAIGILADLVRFDTVSRNSNLFLIDYVEAMLTPLGARCVRVPSSDGAKASLLASFGPLDRPGVILSAHTDVVPVDEQNWSSDPFELAVRDGRAFGRGAADMKGFIASCLALAPTMARLPRDSAIHIALSYDEELGCLGAPDLARTALELYGPQQLTVVGEPTMMRPVIGHKSNLAVEIDIVGRAAHSSLAPTTVNAIDVAAAFLNELARMSSEAAAAGRDSLYDVPTSTVCVTQIAGGTAINIVPAHCLIVAEFRLLPTSDARIFVKRLETVRDELLPGLQARAPEAAINIRELFAYPGLEMSADHPAVIRVMRAAGSNHVAKVAYGTEAGIFASVGRSPTVIVGPGSIEQAHKPDEFIDLDQLDTCQRFLAELLGL